MGFTCVKNSHFIQISVLLTKKRGLEIYKMKFLIFFLHEMQLLGSEISVLLETCVRIYKVFV